MNLKNKTAVITGAGGAIGSEIARAFLNHNAQVAFWDLSLDAAEEKRNALGFPAERCIAVACDATSSESLTEALERTLASFKTVDILVNGAGGSRAKATTSVDLSFFDLDPEAMDSTLALNYASAVLSCQIIGRLFAHQKSGIVINISSIAGISPLTRAVSYSNAKAATNNFTQWLAVYMATEYSPEIRVNAIAPGFILTDQNRFLLIQSETGELTPRGKDVLDNVPAGRFGKPEEIAGAALWLASDLASFVTGAIIPVDGGFTACSGV